MAACYILDDRGFPVREPDLGKWTEWFAGHETAVGREDVNGYFVATVFTGFAESPLEESPLVWESVVLDDHGDAVRSDRCGGGREQAQALHRRMVAVARDEFSVS